MSQTAALLPGTRLQNGAYAVGAILGQGGFGITYRGGDMAGKRYVAIKEFFPPGAIRQGNTIFPSSLSAQTHAQAKSDFLREAQMLARFQNPGIVRVLASFEENNSAYMVMELLEGQSLAARIEEKGALDEWEVLDIALRLASALDAIHGAGILHRDIKPENVMLSRNAGASGVSNPGAQGVSSSGRAVLIDFGTARSFENGSAPMTQIVTPGYAPLEQYAASAKRGPATDIYALGATLYHALSARAPVAATDRAADVPLVPLKNLLPKLTPMVGDAIMSALEMETARRPQTARAFAARLQGRVAPIETPAFAPARPPIPPVSSAMPPIPSATIPTTAPASLVATEFAPIPPGKYDEDGAGIQCLHAKLSRHTAFVNALAFDVSGARLASVGQDRTVFLWGWESETLGAHFGAHAQGITALAFSPDGAYLATGGRDEKVCLWDANLERRDPNLPHLGHVLPLVTLGDCRGVVRDLAFCNARRVLLCADAGALTLWDADSGQIAARRETGCAHAQFSPDGAVIGAAEPLSGMMQLLDGFSLQNRGQISAHDGEISDLAWSPDGALLATSGSDGFVRVWRAGDGTLSWQARPLSVAAGCLSWSPDSRLLALGSGNTVSLWSAQGALWRRFTRHSDRVQALAFTPRAAPYNYVLASASRDKTVNVCRITCETLP